MKLINTVVFRINANIFTGLSMGPLGTLVTFSQAQLLTVLLCSHGFCHLVLVFRFCLWPHHICICHPVVQVLLPTDPLISDCLNWFMCSWHSTRPTLPLQYISHFCFVLLCVYLIKVFILRQAIIRGLCISLSTGTYNKIVELNKFPMKGYIYFSFSPENLCTKYSIL